MRGVSMRFKSIFRIFVYCLFILAMTACIPFLVVDSPPRMPQELPIKLSQNNDKNILVLPIFHKTSGYIREGKNPPHTNMYIDAYYIIKATEIHDLHNIIRVDASFGIGTLASSLESGTTFRGMYLITEWGEVMIMRDTNDVIFNQWDDIFYTKIRPAWIKEIADIFQGSDVISYSREKRCTIWNVWYTTRIKCSASQKKKLMFKDICDNPVKTNFPAGEIDLNLSPADRDKIIAFVHSIKTKHIEENSPCWTVIDVFKE